MPQIKNRILLTVDDDLLKWIDSIVIDLNKKKAAWQPRTNRQQVVNALILYAKTQNPALHCNYGKYVSVVGHKGEGQ